MGRILGIDYGDSRIGLALSDPQKIIASPYKTVNSKDKQKLIDIFNSIIKEKNIEFLVIGLPISLKGKETLQTKKVKVFGEFLKKFNKPIFFQDERFSSITAVNSLISENIKTGHNKDKIDKRAAAIILQQYLDCSK